MLQALRLRTAKSDTAFEKLWEAQRPRVQRLALRLCGNPEQAEDLTQEIGIQALSAYPSFRRECAPTTFLYRIAVRTIHPKFPAFGEFGTHAPAVGVYMVSTFRGSGTLR